MARKTSGDSAPHRSTNDMAPISESKGLLRRCIQVVGEFSVWLTGENELQVTFKPCHYPFVAHIVIVSSSSGFQAG